MKGHVHSVQSLGAVDGPGLRYVVFLQGCPLRCAYCHNPDTWEYGAGEERGAEELVRQILRYRPYFGDKGGVTVSGGKPSPSPPLWRNCLPASAGRASTLLWTPPALGIRLPRSGCSPTRT